MTPTLFSLADVSLRYGRQPVLKGITGRIPASEMTFIIGPNGSGKTTLLKALAGVVPYKGKLCLRGNELSGYSSLQRGKTIGFIGQSPQMNYPFTVFEVILMGRLPYISSIKGYGKADREAALRAASSMELDHMLEKPVTALSGGEKQRVAIAQVLAQDTDVILLDEPSSALDPSHALRLFSLLQEMKGNGKSMVISVHDINLAARFADHLWILKDGAIMAQGNISETLTPELLMKTYDVAFSCYYGKEDERVWHAESLI